MTTAFVFVAGGFLAATLPADDFVAEALGADDFVARDLAADALPTGLLFFKTCRFFVPVFRADVLVTLKSLCGKRPRVAVLYTKIRTQCKAIPQLSTTEWEIVQEPGN